MHDVVYVIKLIMYIPEHKLHKSYWLLGEELNILKYAKQMHLCCKSARVIRSSIVNGYT